MTNHDIAIQILNWKIHTHEVDGSRYWKDEAEHLYCLIGDFNPLSNAQDDCIVLKHIRENWDSRMFAKFCVETAKKLTWEYEPGDFSRAALKVIEESESER